VPELPEPAILPGSVEELKTLTDSVAVHFPDSVDYDNCRRNGTWLLDPISWGRPSAIAVPKTAEEVSAVVKFAKIAKVNLSVACGRHTHESVVQSALMVDLSSGMNDVSIDTEKNLIIVQGGATIGKVDQTCAPHGYILPMGRVGTTGCAGQMITTGAHGYIERVMGLGIDYLHSAVVVVGSGEVVTCSETENADLFWGIRGGQKNFGIVCEMTFNATKAPNDGKFYGGQHVYLNTGLLGMPTREKVMHHVADLMRPTEHPLEYNFGATMIGGSIMNPSIISHFWFGDDQEAGKKYIKENCKKIGTAVADTSGIHDYWNGMQKWANGPKGEDAGPGAYYIRGIMPSKFTHEMAKAASDALNAPMPNGVQQLMFIDMMGGKALEVPAGSMALCHRPSIWIVIVCMWKPEVTGPEGRDVAINWVRNIWKQLVELDSKDDAGKLKVDPSLHLEDVENIIKETMEMGQQAKVGDIWGANEERMKSIKLRYDPDNVFGCNIPSFTNA